MTVSRADCERLDANDPLAHVRERFHLPEGVIYLDGNSLGALPAGTPAKLQQVVAEQWGNDLIASWNTHGWIDYPISVGERIAPLVGAAPGQIICTDSVSNNLFKVLTSALALRPGRTTILSTADNFPTDLYMAQGIEDLLGSDRCVLETAPLESLADALDEKVAVLMLTEVDFRTGERLDMAAWTRRAHEAGALIAWDLSHSTGAFPVELDQAGADFAVGCGYKFLCGGPGAPAFVYVAERLQETAKQPLAGWMGHARPFGFEARYEPASGIARFASGTPPIIAMAALDAALDIFDGIDLETVHAKSIALSETFEQLIVPTGNELALAGPTDASRRGSQISFRAEGAYAMIQALIEQGVIGDFREPDILRFGFAPLYTRFVDVFDAANALCDVVKTGRWRAPVFSQRQKVT